MPEPATRPRRLLRCLATCLLAASPCLAQVADGRDIVVGASGEIYRVRTGAYGDLFPGGRAAERDNSVVALEVTPPGGAMQRLLVPGTELEEIESDAALVFEDASREVFLVWQSRVNVIHTLLQLASFDGSKWSRRIDVTGNSFVDKTAPRLVVTRDRFADVDAAGAAVQRTRTIIHLLWGEQAAGGVDEVLYAPVVLLDGAYLGWNPVYRLNELDTQPEKATAPALAGLARAPALALGHDQRTVIAAFVSVTTGRLTTVEIDALPGELSSLADGARAQIIHLGAALGYPANRATLARKAAAAVQADAAAFEPEVRALLGAEIERFVLSRPDDGLSALGAGARAQIIHIGSRLGNRGLFSKAVATRTRAIAETPDGGAEDHGHLLRMSVAASWPAVAAGAEPRIFVAPAGRAALVAWRLDGEVRYRQTQGTGWSDVRGLALGNGLDLARAYQILEQRVRSN